MTPANLLFAICLHLLGTPTGRVSRYVRSVRVDHEQFSHLTRPSWSSFLADQKFNVQPLNQWNDCVDTQGMVRGIADTRSTHRQAAAGFRVVNRILGGLNVIFAAPTAAAMFSALNGS
jgi:hypothetical protein